MSSQYENNGSTVGSSSCAYNRLSNYGETLRGFRPQIPDLPYGQVAGTYVVPDYTLPGYNSLIHDLNGGCGGYATIDKAYGTKDGSCNTKYVRMPCGAM